MDQSSLLKLYSRNLAVDVILKVDGDDREIKAHRLILLAASKYFEDIFTGDKKERDSVVTLKEMRFETLQTLIDFIYIGALTLRCSFLEAFVAADRLKIDSVKVELNDYAEFATLKKCMDVYGAYKYLDAESKKAVLKLIRKNLWELFPKKEFCSLSVDQLLNILTEPSPVHVSQRDHILAINAWVLAAPEERYPEVHRLLSSVVFSKKMKIDFIMEKILPICKNLESLNFLVAVMAWNNGYSDDFVNKYIAS